MQESLSQALDVPEASLACINSGEFFEDSSH